MEAIDELVAEAVVGFADLGGEVDGIGVGGGVVGLGVDWSCDGGSDEDNEQEGEDFYAAFYGSSPMPIENFMLDGTIELLTK